MYLGNFHPQAEDRKDSDDEKSDRNRPWWKKRFVSAIPKGKETRHLVILGMPSFLKWKMTCCTFKSDLFDCCPPLFVVAGRKKKSSLNRKWQEISHFKEQSEKQFIMWEREWWSMLSTPLLMLQLENYVSCCLKLLQRRVHSVFSHVSLVADLYRLFKANQSSEEL